MTGQAVRDEGVHRGVGALVDLGGELFAVDEVGDGLAHGLGLVGVGIGLGFAVGLNLEVEGDEALLTARALDDLDLGVLGEVLDVGRAQGAVGHVDLALLDGHLQVGGVGEVLDLHDGVLGRGQTLVGVVLGVGGGLVDLEGCQRVRAGEGLLGDDGVGVGELVGVEGILIDDRAGGAGHDLLQGHVEGHGILEHHGGVVLGGHGFDVGEQGARAVRVVDLLDAIVGELDVGSGQVVAVGKLQAVLELDGEFGAVIVPGTVIGGDVRAQLGGVVVLGIQEREHLDLHGVGAVVVGAGGVQAGDLIGGADGDDVAGIGGSGGVILHTAAGGQGCDGGHGDGGGQNLLGIQQESSLITCFHVITAGVDYRLTMVRMCYLCVSIVIDLCFACGDQGRFYAVSSSITDSCITT